MAQEKYQTFVVRIKGTTNHTCQGVLKWVDQDKTVPFRSTLEMLQLLDSAVQPTEDTDTEEN